jgi:hypothetical protein
MTTTYDEGKFSTKEALMKTGLSIETGTNTVVTETNGGETYTETWLEGTG